MAQQRPLCRIAGRTRELPIGDKPAGFWAKAVATNASGTLSATIPAGYFAAAPIVVGNPIAPGATRDHILTLTAVTFNADKSVTVTGFVRRTNVLSVAGDTTSALPTQVMVHLQAMESD